MHDRGAIVVIGRMEDFAYVPQFMIWGATSKGVRNSN
jgi:hypothetical protein